MPDEDHTKDPNCRQEISESVVHKFEKLALRLANRTAHIAVLGLGYAGLPMAIALAEAGFSVTGLDVDESKVRSIQNGKSPVTDVSDNVLSSLIERSLFRASARFDLLKEADCALICVPTPLTVDRQPDLSFVIAATESIANHLHPGMLVVLQSTCGPGTTRRVILPILAERSQLEVGTQFSLAFAPERIDPGNVKFGLKNTPKIVGGLTPQCTGLAELLFSRVVAQVFPVSNPETAEMSKMVENTFRFINIGFANEVAMLCDKMGLNVWEVLDAASTKPFAFMPHTPGPGVGGHCIPVVPFYLEAVTEQYGLRGDLVQAAGRVNDGMPQFVVDKLERLLSERGRSLSASSILLLGMAYKPDLADTRESPSPKVANILRARKVSFEYYDPYVANVRCGEEILDSLSPEELAMRRFDCAVLLTAHHRVDYAQIAKQVDFIFDTRNQLSCFGLDNVISL